MRLTYSISKNTSLDNLTEVPAIEPSTTALGATIDLDTESLGHHEIGSAAHWAFHLSSLRKLFFGEHDRPSTLRQAYVLLA